MGSTPESRPVAVSVIGWLLVYAGVIGVLGSVFVLITWSVPSWRSSIEGFMKPTLLWSTVYFPLVAAVFMPLGLGLLRRRPRSRQAARWLFLGLIPVFYAIAVATGLTLPGSAKISDWVFGMVAATAWAAVLLFGAAVLNRPTVRSHFDG